MSRYHVNQEDAYLCGLRGKCSQDLGPLLADKADVILDARYKEYTIKENDVVIRVSQGTQLQEDVLVTAFGASRFQVNAHLNTFLEKYQITEQQQPQMLLEDNLTHEKDALPFLMTMYFP